MSTSVVQEDVVPHVAIITDRAADILQFAYDSFVTGTPVALVTLVKIRRGAARPLGAHMAVRADGGYCGFVSGGCTEGVVAAEAIAALRVGHDRILKLGEGSPFFDIVLPCGGGIDVSIHVLREVHPVEIVLSRLAVRRPATLRYSPASQCIEFGGAVMGESGWKDDGFETFYQPKTRLVLCGRSIELTTTVQIARATGYDVVQIDQSMDPSDFAAGIDEFSAVVLLFHDLDCELPLLRGALTSKSFYIGALGSRRTHEKRCAALRKLGFGHADIAKIKAPIGIFDKARDASSIALSVLADIAAAKIRSR